MIFKERHPDLDLFLALMVLIASPLVLIYMLTSSARPIYFYAIPFAIVPCLIWLFIRRKGMGEIPFRSSKRVVWAGATAFFLLLTITILILYYNENIYERPIAYFILVAVMAGIISTEIVYASHRMKSMILGQIIILCGLAVFSQILIFPDLVGIDPFYHRWVVNGLIEQGEMPPYSGNYKLMPAYHIILGASQMMTSLSFKLTLLLTVSTAILVLNIILIYLITKFVTSNVTISLFSSLVVGIVSFHIQGAYLAYPNTLALILCAVFLYLLIRQDKGHYRYAFLMVVRFASTFFMHSIAILFILISLFVIYVTIRIFKELKIERRISLPSLLISGVLVLLGWSWIGHLDILINPPKKGSGYLPPQSGGADPPQMISQLIDPSIQDQLINYAGIFVFYSLSILGILVLIYFRKRYPYGVPIALVALTPFVIGTSFELLGAYGFNERWWLISQILLSIPAGVALYIIIREIRRPGPRAIITLFVVTCLSLLLMANTFANIDNDFFSPSMNIRYSITTSEMQAAEVASTIFGMPIRTDDYYASRLNDLGHNASGISTRLEYAHFAKLTGVILLRDEVASGTFSIGGKPVQLGYEPEETLYNESFNKILRNRSVSAFVYAQ